MKTALAFAAALLLFCFIPFAEAKESSPLEPETAGVGEARSGGPLDIRAPKRLVLGQEGTAGITLVKPDGAEPVLLVNVGTISAPAKTDKGRLVSTYTPPEERFPQVAIIAAVSRDHSLLDWIAIPLFGKAGITTKTEPNATVEIRIGDAVFGPARADARGRTNMNVVVPPGFEQGVTVATDKVGNQKRDPLELGVPPFGRIMGICPKMGDRMVLLVVDRHGNPEKNASLALEASSGGLKPATTVAPGVYQSSFAVSEDAKIGQKVILKASLQEEEVSEAACQVEIRGGQLAGLKLSPAPATWVAGSDTAVSLGVEFLNPDGGPAQPAPLEIETDLGEVSEVRSVSRGKFEARWTLPDRLEGRRKARIEARSRTDSTIAAEATVVLQPGSASQIELSLADRLIMADGRSTTVVTARALDAFGNPIRKAAFKAEAAGKIGEFADKDGDGAYESVYTAPKRDERSKDTITVREDSAGVEANVPVTLWSERPSLSLGPRIGYSGNFGKISAPFFAADFAYCPPFLHRNLSFGFELGFYFSNTREKSAEEEEMVKTSIWVLPLLARIAYQIPVEPFAFYFGISGGLAVSDTETESESASRTAYRKAHGGLSGIGGADMTLGPGRVVIEVEYLYTFTKNINIEGNLGGLLATAGYRFELL